MGAHSPGGGTQPTPAGARNPGGGTQPLHPGGSTQPLHPGGGTQSLQVNPEDYQGSEGKGSQNSRKGLLRIVLGRLVDMGVALGVIGLPLLGTSEEGRFVLFVD